MSEKRWWLGDGTGQDIAARRVYAGSLPGPFDSWSGALAHANLAARNDRLTYRITHTSRRWWVEPDGRRCDPKVWYVNCSWYGYQEVEYTVTIQHLPSGRIYGAKSHLSYNDARRKAFAGILAAFDAGRL